MSESLLNFASDPVKLAQCSNRRSIVNVRGRVTCILRGNIVYATMVLPKLFRSRNCGFDLTLYMRAFMLVSCPMMQFEYVEF